MSAEEIARHHNLYTVVKFWLFDLKNCLNKPFCVSFHNLWTMLRYRCAWVYTGHGWEEVQRREMAVAAQMTLWRSSWAILLTARLRSHTRSHLYSLPHVETLGKDLSMLLPFNTRSPTPLLLTHGSYFQSLTDAQMNNRISLMGWLVYRLYMILVYIQVNHDRIISKK